VRLAGKVILVTGAGTGLGHAAALRSAREGARLSLLDVAIRE
jgi:NAD(P)-dependent dehydrogenase (short-subunit alcohol dehydrogenase family)